MSLWPGGLSFFMPAKDSIVVPIESAQGFVGKVRGSLSSYYEGDYQPGPSTPDQHTDGYRTKNGGARIIHVISSRERAAAVADLVSRALLLLTERTGA